MELLIVAIVAVIAEPQDRPWLPVEAFNGVDRAFTYHCGQSFGVCEYGAQ